MGMAGMGTDLAATGMVIEVVTCRVYASLLR